MTAPTMLRVSARVGTPGFRTLNLSLQAGRWTMLDVSDPKVRGDVLAYCPSHISLAPGQDAALEAAGLVMVTDTWRQRFASDPIVSSVLQPLPAGRLAEIATLDAAVSRARAIAAASRPPPLKLTAVPPAPDVEPPAAETSPPAHAEPPPPTPAPEPIATPPPAAAPKKPAK